MNMTTEYKDVIHIRIWVSYLTLILHLKNIRLYSHRLQ